jgi:thiamine monophosphate synthase
MNQKVSFEIKKFNKKNSKKDLPVSVFFSNRAVITSLESTIKHLPKNSAIIIREYDLEEKDREIFAKKIVALARPLGLKILVGKDLSLAKKIKADGVHFSDFDKLPLQFISQKNFPEKFPRKFIFSFSCHNLKSALKAEKSGFDMIFISPIFPTTSHLNTKNIGLKNLAKISLKTKSTPYCKSSFYALGGINSQNLSSIRKLNLAGFGAISLFLNHS